MKKYNPKDILSVLVYIRHTYGLEAFAKRGRLVALISDLAPTLSDERNLIERMDKLGIIEEFALGTEASDSAKKRIVAKSIELLTKKEFIQHKIATKYSVVVADALGWSQEVTSEFCRSQNNQSGNNPPLNMPAPNRGRKKPAPTNNNPKQSNHPRTQNNQSGNNPPLNVPAPNRGRKKSAPTNNNPKQTNPPQTTSGNLGGGASKGTTSSPTNTTNTATSKDWVFKAVFVVALAFLTVVTIATLNYIKTHGDFDAFVMNCYFKLLIAFLLAGIAYGLNAYKGFGFGAYFEVWPFVLVIIYAVVYGLLAAIFVHDGFAIIVVPMAILSHYMLACGVGWITMKICSKLK